MTAAANDYAWWRNALKGIVGQITADEPMAGFYRGKRRDKQTGAVTFQAIAYWYKDGELHCHVNQSPVDDQRAREIWPYVSKNPISDQVYFAVVRDGKGRQLFKPVSARTINNSVVSTLRRVIRRARKNWNATIFREPNWGDHMLPVSKRPVREITTAEDVALDQVESKDFRELREFAEIMGLRRRELLLQWQQVDFDLGVIRIIGKGGKPATVPLSKRAYQMLWSLRGNHKQWVFTFVAQRTRTCPKTGTRFIRGQRYPMTYHGIGTNRRRKWAKAGVDARLHDTRHTTGMRTLRTTGNLKLVQKLLRHSKIATTSEFYTDADVDDVRAGMEATAEATKSRKKSQSGAAPIHKSVVRKKK